MTGAPYPLNDADLALIEIGNPGPLVERLIQELRLLREDNLFLGKAADELFITCQELKARDS